MLSPCIWQVTHALLTRPPLRIHKIWPKPPQRIFSVRLACVKHAASVHPEPGSNSRIIMSDLRIKTSLAFLISVLQYCCLVCICPILSENFLLEFSGLHYCLFVKVQNRTIICAFRCRTTCVKQRTEKEGFEPSRRY